MRGTTGVERGKSETEEERNSCERRESSGDTVRGSKIPRNLGKRRVAVAAIGHWAIFAGIHASVLAVFIGKVSLVGCCYTRGLTKRRKPCLFSHSIFFSLFTSASRDLSSLSSLRLRSPFGRSARARYS